MKNALVCLYVISALSGTLSSCGGNETESYTCPNIVGEWEWKKFVGGFGNPDITPDSLGITKTLIIDDAYITVLINDTLQYSTTYKCELISNSHYSLQSIELGTGETYIPYIYNDTLELGIILSGQKDIYWRK